MTVPQHLGTSIANMDKPPGIKDLVFIRTNSSINKVRLIDINWIHADGNYSYIHTSNRRFVVKISLKKLFSKLASSQFIRVHKSYVIQVNAIDKIDTNLNQVYVAGRQIPVGRVFKTDLLKRLDII